MSRSHWTHNGPVRLHYLDSDPDATGHPIIFVPGLTDVADDYLPILDEFGRRVIVADLRGRGRSDTPIDGYSLAEQAGDIDTIVNAATAGPVHLMTFSRGTCYALGWACDNVDRILSIAIGDYPAREIIFPEGLEEHFMAATWRGTPVDERLDRRAFAGITRDVQGRTFWDELGSFDVPILVVRSPAEGPVSDEDWANYQERVPQATYVSFDESPHDIFRPDRLRYPGLVRDLADLAES